MLNKKLFILGAIIFSVLVFSELVSASTQISDCQQLQNMKNNLAGDYILIENIDCSMTTTWNSGAGFEPIGSQNSPFTGNFSGNNLNITGLYINRPISFVGLFSVVSNYAIIKDIGLVDVNITGGNKVGGLIGSSSASRISNSYSTGNVKGVNYVGGLIG
ncbi:MAG: GLUG motif-containing protein [Nanoarchaeota archaeon]